MSASTRVQHETWMRVAGGCEQARDMAIRANVSLVPYVVGRMNLSPSGALDRDDLISAGNLGLIDAVERYDPTRGIAFSTYAIRRIRGAIMDSLRSMDWAPRSVRSRQRTVERGFQAFSQREHREPDLAELAVECSMSSEGVEKALEDARLAMQRPLDPGPSAADAFVGRPANQVADDSASPEQEGEMVDMRRVIAAGMDRVSEQARVFFALYYFEDRSLSDIGELLGVTDSRVCQIHTSFMRELRAAF